VRAILNTPPFRAIHWIRESFCKEIPEKNYEEARLSKLSEEELMVCIMASQSDAMKILFQFCCLVEISGRSKKFSSPLSLAAEAAPLEAL